MRALSLRTNRWGARARRRPARWRRRLSQGPARTSAPARTLRNSVLCSTKKQTVCLKQAFCSSCSWLPLT